MSVQRIEQLINNGANETEIKEILKSDLSIIGEYFSSFQIRNEYIAFSEVRIGDQVADFVVFTNRSRMEVFIIEIKGVDFNFINKDKTISAVVNQDIQALRSHFSCIEQDKRYYREKFHKMRTDVEQGKTIHNSFRGTDVDLHVDPNKDIVIVGAFIGGKTVDDIEESVIRNNIESADKRLKIESWNSWIRKVKN